MHGYILVDGHTQRVPLKAGTGKTIGLRISERKQLKELGFFTEFLNEISVCQSKCIIDGLHLLQFVFTDMMYFLKLRAFGVFLAVENHDVD